MIERILYGGTILTMDERQPEVTALAIESGRVAAVGADNEMLALRRDGTVLQPLDGRTVCPGFIDAHHHLTHAAWCQLGIDLEGCRSVRAVQRRLIAGMAAARTGPWLYAFNYMPQHFNGKRLTRHDLDRVVGDRPALIMHFSLHEGVVSSAGLRAAGIDRHTADPQGGRIARDRQGEPSGELIETAIGPVEALARGAAAGTGYEDWLAGLQRYCLGLFAAGITHVCDPGVDAMLEGYLRRAQREGRLPIPVTMLFVSGRGLFQPPADRLAGPRTGEQVDGLAIGALKLFADGGSRCASCVGLLESLAGVTALAGRAVRLRRPGLLVDASAPDRPHLTRDGTLRVGYLHYEPGALGTLCADARARGFGLAVHAACNAGVEAALHALEPLPASAHRHRVEHLVSLDRRQIDRLSRTGAIGVVQPAYIGQMGDEWEAMPTPSRLRSVPLRDLINAGVTLAGSSDAPIAPYSPLEGMTAAATRRTKGGLIHQGEQAITAHEALRMWTVGAAQAAYREGAIGILRQDSQADLVVLSANPLEIAPEHIDRIRVLETVITGKTVYSVDAWGKG